MHMPGWPAPVGHTHQRGNRVSSGVSSELRPRRKRKNKTRSRKHEERILLEVTHAREGPRETVVERGKRLGLSIATVARRSEVDGRKLYAGAKLYRDERLRIECVLAAAGRGNDDNDGRRRRSPTASPSSTP